MRALRDLVYAAQAIASGSIGSLELIDACLDRYRATEPDIHAFVWFDEDRARQIAARRDREPRLGALHGVPVGVKDIFDTAGIPTEYGSPLFAGRVPRTSSAVVDALEAAGAVIVGKTVTAELAFHSAGPTRNPHDLARTPGGSSQGSAAAVAAGVVPAAVGSQTNGSTIRPAAFCGVVGFKPSSGRIRTDGAMEFSRTLDQVGGITGTIDSAGLFAAILAKEDPNDWKGELPAAPRVAVAQTSDWSVADEAMRDRFLTDVKLVEASGASVEWPPLPDGLDDAPELVRVLMAYESARAIGSAAFDHRELVSEAALALFDSGRAMTSETYDRAMQERARLISAFSDWVAPYEAVLTPPAAGEAPQAITTGDGRFCSRWSLLGAPAITIPTGAGPAGLPLGLQLVGSHGSDQRLLATARWVERRIRQPDD